MNTITTISINNVAKGANTDILTNAVKYARCGLDVKLLNNKISAISKKVKKLEDMMTIKEDDLRIIDGCKAEIKMLENSIDKLNTEKEGYESDYNTVIDSITASDEPEEVAINLINFYACEGSKKYYSLAFEVEEDCLARLRVALDNFWGKITSDGSRHTFSNKDLKEVKSAVAYILKNFFSLNNDGDFLTKKPVKTSNELVRSLCDMYIQNCTSILRKNGKGVKAYDGIKVKTLVTDSKKGTNYSKLLASVVDLYVIPQYTVKYVEKKSK